jgi:GNAT superfamily N-acetyltransferase
MLWANAECEPWTAISHAIPPSTGPRASGTRRGLPLRRPLVSSTTHHGATPASERASGLATRQKAIAIRLRDCSRLVTRDMIAAMSRIRPCRDGERAEILAIDNAAAEAYRGVIPADRWHEPYMPADELDREIEAGVAFSGYESGGSLIGVMGIQAVRDVDLIRHAYVKPGSQGSGVGSALLDQFARSTSRPMLVGTWAAAEWAIRFYRRHGFEQVSPERKAALLKAYWTIPARQIETSVVLAKPPISAGTRPSRKPSGRTDSHSPGG